jgi:hypothetical protein
VIHPPLDFWFLHMEIIWIEFAFSSKFNGNFPKIQKVPVTCVGYWSQWLIIWKKMTSIRHLVLRWCLVNFAFPCVSVPSERLVVQS